MLIATFRLQLTASLHQVMRSIVYMSLFSCSTLVRSILVIIPVVRWCSLTGPHQWGVGSRASLGRTK